MQIWTATDSLQEGSDSVTEMEVAVKVTARELIFLAAAVGKALEAVEEWEFQTRLGELRDTAKATRADIKAVLRSPTCTLDSDSS